MNRTLCLLVALAGTGCGLIKLVSPAKPGDTSVAEDGSHRVTLADGRTYRVGPYWGPECDRIGAPRNEVTPYTQVPEPTMGKQPNLSHDPADQIFRLVCVEEVLSSESEPERDTWVMQHFRFDEVFFDHTTAAMMLVQCLKASSCLGEGAKPVHKELHNDIAMRMQAEQEARPRPAYSYYEVGMMKFYADHVDRMAVAAKLTSWQLPQAAQVAFLADLDHAKARVTAVANELVPDAKRLFVDLPDAIYAQRAQARAKYQPIITQLGALVDQVKTERGAGGVTDATIGKLVKLRVAYHNTCKGDTCTKDAIFAGITKQLFWGYVSRGDAAAAMAESKLLDKLEPSAAVEIATKQEAAIDKARGRLERVSAARNQGIDADAARSTANGTVLDLGDGHYVYRWSSEFAIDWNALVPDGHEVGKVGGKIASLESRGANTFVRFQDDVSSYAEDTDCYETNRIDGIDSSGHIIYREQCRGTTTHVERHKVDPVMVPASEGALLHTGDDLVGFARGTGDKRLGRVWMVSRGTRVTRLREVAL